MKHHTVTKRAFRIGLAVWIAAVLVAQPVSVTSAAAQQPPARTATAKVVLTSDQGRLVVAENPHLGVVQAGEIVKVQLELVNATSNELVVNKIVTQVDRATPDKGKILPGETLTFSYRWNTSPRPNSQSGVDFIEVHCGGHETCFFQCRYSYATYVGIAKSIVVVPLQQTGPVSDVRFDVPIVIGGALKNGDFDISLDGVEGSFEFRIDQDAKQLHCQLQFEKPLESARLQASLVVLDLASGFVRETPIVFERPKTLEILPTFLEFVPDEADDGYVAMLYVRRLSSQDETQLSCNVDASLLGTRIATQVTSINDDLIRCRLKISRDQLEKLAKSMTDSREKRQLPSTEMLQLSVTSAKTKIEAPTPFSIQGQTQFQSKPLDKLFVVDAIKTGMAAMTSLSPFEIYGTTTTEHQFGDEPRKIVGQIRFRMWFDQKNQIAVYATETKPDRMAILRGTAPEGIESVQYYRTIAIGNLLSASGVSTGQPLSFDSFEQAISNYYIPLPADWGVFEFPGHSSIDKEIESWAVQAGNASSQLIVTSGSDQIRVSLSDDAPGPKAGIWMWDYQLPHFRPTLVKRQHAKADKPNLYQTIQWGRVRGHDVPQVVTAESIAVRRVSDAENPFQIGKGFEDTQLKWLSFDPQSSAAAKEMMQQETPEAIKKFIDEGEQQAMRLGN